MTEAGRIRPVRSAVDRPGGPAAAGGDDPLLRHRGRQFRRLHRRLDAVDRHAADLMFLTLSAQDLLLGRRHAFSERSRSAMREVAAGEPYGGRCPCCGGRPVLDVDGRAAPGVEYDHFLHRGPNRPEHGWPICAGCHAGLTGGGYLARFARMPEFRAFQAAVLGRRRRAEARRAAGAAE
jgi:hypothetical protein